MRHFLISVLLTAFVIPSFSQHSSGFSSDQPGPVNTRLLSGLSAKYQKLVEAIRTEAKKTWKRVQNEEDDLKKNLSKRDSVLSAQLFDGQISGSLDSAFGKELKLPRPSSEYNFTLDSITTALGFLKQTSVGAMTRKLTETGIQVSRLEESIHQSNTLKKYIERREQFLRERLGQLPVAKQVVKQMTAINKETFYYAQKLNELKSAINDKNRMEEVLLNKVRQLPSFQKFWQKNSYLSQLFPVHANYGTPQALEGLPTRADMKLLMQQRFGTPPATPGAQSPNGGSHLTDGNQYLQQQLAGAQQQLGKLKSKMSKSGYTNDSGKMTMPDLKPNSQRTKSFFQRMEYGLNVQSEKWNSVLPVTTDVAFTIGYKLNDKSTVGLGGSYKLGWGQDFRHLRFTSQGVGLRSYIDVKAKKSFWLTGGCEMNYLSGIKKYEDLYPLNAWQKSGLIGLTQKIKIGKKENDIQLLWDFLSYSEIPRSPALKFRVGWKF